MIRGRNERGWEGVKSGPTHCCVVLIRNLFFKSTVSVKNIIYYIHIYMHYVHGFIEEMLVYFLALFFTKPSYAVHRSPDPDMCSLGNTPLLIHPAPSLPLYGILRDFQLSIASYQCDCEIRVFLSVISECFGFLTLCIFFNQKHMCALLLCYYGTNLC